MTDRPIIFSAPMVRALLAGRKAQTRRVLKLAGRTPEFIGPRGCEADPTCWGWEMPDGYLVTVEGDEADHAPGWQNGWRDWAGAYAPGDRLWVREACRAEELSQPPGERPATKAEREKLGRTKVPVMSELDGADGVRYLADDSWRIIENSPAASDRWIDLFHYRGRGEARIGNPVPSIHMPRWASRLTLTVSDVRLQRLQEISEADAVAEGCEAYRLPGPWWQGYRETGDGDLVHQQVIGDEPPDWMIEPHRMRDDTHLNRSAIDAFRGLWTSLHGLGAWDANPWVSAITFSVTRGNIDQMPGVSDD